MNKAVKQILSPILAVAIVLTGIMAVHKMSMPVQAAMPTTNIQVGQASHGVDFTELSKPNNGIYYGDFDHAISLSAVTSGTPTYEGISRPILWKVMGEEANEEYVTLMSEYAIDSRAFFPYTSYISANGKINRWENSELRAWLNNGNFTGKSDTNTAITGAMPKDYNSNGFLNSFSPAELNQMKNTEVNTSVYTWNTTAYESGSTITTTDNGYLPWGTYNSGTDLNRNKMWWEAIDYDGGMPSGGTNTAIDKQATLKGSTTSIYWWLRSPNSINSAATLYINPPGGVNSGYVNSQYGVRPALKLNPKSVIFSSEIKSGADTGKGETEADSFNYSIATAVGAKNYKLTVLNTSLNLTNLQHGGLSIASNPSIKTTPGGTIALAGNGDSGTKLTYKIVDSSNVIVGYGQSSDNAAVTVNALANTTTGGNLVDGNYTVYVWAQKDNATRSNDGSQPQHFTLVVDSTDTTAPTVTTVTPNTQNEELASDVVITFSEAMNPSVTGTINLDNGIGNLTGGTWSNSNMTYTVPYTGLAYDITYNITISGFADSVGNVMANDSNHSFKTRAMTQIATPVANPTGSEVVVGTQIDLSCTESGATIHYTTDGTIPTASSAVYSSQITVNSAMTIKAIAVKSGMADSALMSESYTILVPGKVAQPTTKPTGGKVVTGTQVELSCTESGATIYYTTNGTTPTISSPVYSTPITVNSEMTIKAIAVKSGMADSAVMSESYTILVPGTVAIPTANPTSGAVSLGTTVYLKASESGATIHYTTDGSAPTTSSSIYSTPITVNSEMTIKAIAVKSGMVDSAVMSESYTIATITPPQPTVNPEVIPTTPISIDLNTTKTTNLTVTLGQSGGGTIATQVDISIDNTAVAEVLPTTLTSDGNVMVTAKAVGKANITVSFNTGKTVNIPISVTNSYSASSTSGGSSSSSGGSSKVDAVPVIPLPAQPKPVTKEEVEKALNNAISKLPDGSKDVIVTINNPGTISHEVLQHLERKAAEKGLTFTLNLDTVENGRVIGRITLRSSSVKGGGFIPGFNLTRAHKIEQLFRKYLSNNLFAVCLNQKGKLDRTISVIVKMPSHMKAVDIVIYSYDMDTNTYKKLDTKAWNDKNGYLHFDTTIGGDFVISNGDFVKK